MMFRSFISWLDSYISREEPAAILKALVGLMAFAGLLGTIFGNQAIRVGAFVVVIVFVVAVILLLLADRRRLTRAYEAQRTLLARYCNYVVESSSDPHVAIKRWRQDVYLDPDGDVREVLTLTAVALREVVYFIRLTAGCRWDQPEKYRREVCVTARSLKSGGERGPRWHVTTAWLTTQKMVSILHMHEPVSRGDEVVVEVVRTWPAKCLPLMREREVEEFLLRTSDFLQVRNVEYTVVAPHGFDAVYELIGAMTPGAHLSVEESLDKENRKVFKWCADKVPTSEHVGIRIELTQ